MAAEDSIGVQTSKTYSMCCNVVEQGVIVTLPLVAAVRYIYENGEISNT